MKVTTEEMFEILSREFPLMSSRKLMFLTAGDVVSWCLHGELQGCDALNETLEKYVAELQEEKQK